MADCYVFIFTQLSFLFEIINLIYSSLLYTTIANRCENAEILEEIGSNTLITFLIILYFHKPQSKRPGKKKKRKQEHLFKKMGTSCYK